MKRGAADHLPLVPDELWLVSGNFPAARTFMNLLNVSNQNGAPRETARTDMSKPMSFQTHPSAVVGIRSYWNGSSFPFTLGSVQPSGRFNFSDSSSNSCRAI